MQFNTIKKYHKCMCDPSSKYLSESELFPSSKYLFEYFTRYFTVYVKLRNNFKLHNSESTWWKLTEL